MGNAEPTHTNNSNKFESFNTIDQDNIIDQIPKKQPKPPPIFIDSVSNIKSSGQVKIQAKTSDAYKTVVKELESKNTQFYTYL